MARKALIVGINDYEYISSLKGCVNDADNITKLLDYNDDDQQTRNFFTTKLTTNEQQITREVLKSEVKSLFKSEREISLFYFAGHGYVENGHGYLVTSECKKGTDGLLMSEVLKYANDSPALHKIIILDCCFSGVFGQVFLNEGLTNIANNVSIIAASEKNEYAQEIDGNGVFTTLLCHALSGGAASILGEITIGSIYGYVEKAMGDYGQRPIFITRVSRYSYIRKIASQVDTGKLRKITELFETPDMVFPLNKTYEWTQEEAIPEHVETFKILQSYNRVNLLTPVGATDMYWAALNKKACRLTKQGESIWEMAKKQTF